MVRAVLRPLSVHKRFAPLYGLVGGAALGATIGAWTVASHGPGRAAEPVSTSPPPHAPACPGGYAQGEGEQETAERNDRPMLLARCDPRASEAPFSESLEVLFSHHLLLDGRLRGDALTRWVRAAGQGSALVLETPGAPQNTTVASVPAVASDTDGWYHMPPLTIRAWELPAGPNTLHVQLVTPRTRADAAVAEARAAIERVTGLRAYDTTTPSARGWHVQAACPPGYSDATVPGGGRTALAYLGRYCLLPDASGGTELSFAEMTTRADNPAEVRRLFELSATSLTALGVPAGQGFGPSEPFRAGGVEGTTATMDVTPPAAHVRLRAYIIPAGEGTLYAAATSTLEHAARTRGDLEEWIAASTIAAPYNAAVVEAQRRKQVQIALFFPAAFTAVLGAFIGAILRRRALDQAPRA